jgi:hypothetical protein
MNQIAFKIEFSEECGDQVVIPVIDGQDLPSILKAHEAQFANYEGHPELAGQYGGLPISQISNPALYFLGQSTEDNLGDDKTSVLECTCGSTGCWPFLVRITTEGDFITWSDFEQPHRNPDSAGSYWNYSSVPPFQFSSEQYEAAVSHTFPAV